RWRRKSWLATHIGLPGRRAHGISTVSEVRADTGGALGDGGAEPPTLRHGPGRGVIWLATMRPLLLCVFCLIAAVSRCDSPEPHLPPPDPKPGDSVRLRGTLDDDVDCRLLRSEGGKVYSLNQRLPRLA